MVGPASAGLIVNRLGEAPEGMRLVPRYERRQPAFGEAIVKNEGEPWDQWGEFSTITEVVDGEPVRSWTCTGTARVRVVIGWAAALRLATPEQADYLRRAYSDLVSEAMKAKARFRKRKQQATIRCGGDSVLVKAAGGCKVLGLFRFVTPWGPVVKRVMALGQWRG